MTVIFRLLKETRIMRGTSSKFQRKVLLRTQANETDTERRHRKRERNVKDNGPTKFNSRKGIRICPVWQWRKFPVRMDPSEHSLRQGPGYVLCDRYELKWKNGKSKRQKSSFNIKMLLLMLHCKQTQRLEMTSCIVC